MGLLQRVEQMAAQDTPESSPEERETFQCADGYLRRSPAQPYRTPPDYRRRVLLRWGLMALAAALAVLAVWELFQTGLLRF